MKIIKVINLIIAVSCYSLFTACSHKDCCDHTSQTIIGTGDLVSESINLGEFTRFSLEGQGNVTITKGDTQKITLRAQQNILDVLTAQVNNNELVLSQPDTNIQTSKGIFLDIITPDSITKINIFGAGNVNISGDKQNSLDINISGTGDINAYNLEVDNCTIHLAGTGNCKVFVNKKLDVSISGVGNILYKGHPSVIQSISGIGSVTGDN